MYKLKSTFSVDDLVAGIIAEADYDLSKELDEDTAEEPEFVEYFKEQLRAAAMRYLEATNEQ